MTIKVVQGDDFNLKCFLPDKDGFAVDSASFYVVSGNLYIIPLKLTDEDKIWELKIPADMTSNMFVGTFRCYMRLVYENTIVEINTDIDNIEILYKYNKAN